jgi:hypothetical protein
MSSFGSNPGVINQSAPERFCHNCGTPNPSEYSFCLRCGKRISFLPAAPAAAAGAVPLAPAYPVRFEADYPESLSRASTLLRVAAVFPIIWIGALLSSVVPTLGAALLFLFLPLLPIYLFLYLLVFLLFWALFIYWITVVLRGGPVNWLFATLLAILQFFFRAYSYLILMTDRYPPFDGDWPVRVEAAMPTRISRWQLLFWKSLMALPHFIVLSVLSLVVGVFTLIGWIAIMFTGRYPMGLYNFVAGWMRWCARVGAYWMSLTDQFPAFSLAAEAGPGSRRSYVISALIGAALFLITIGGCVAAATTIDEEIKEVDVSYAALRAGRPSESETVSGIEVQLLAVEDPHEPPLSRGSRLVQFTIRMENTDAFFALIDEDDFTLTDSFDDRHGPSFLNFGGSDEPPFDLDQGDEGEVSATFEIDELADPDSLTYEPVFSGFGFGGAVRFNFR